MHLQSIKSDYILNVGTLQSLYMKKVRMHHLSVSYMKNAMYGWIISDFKTKNDTITILESNGILKCNSVVKHQSLKGFYSNTANNIE